MLIFSDSPKNITVSIRPWYSADGNQETFIGTGMSLSIRVSKDRRILFCKAGNEIGVGGSGSIQIEVQCKYHILHLFNMFSIHI